MPQARGCHCHPGCRFESREVHFCLFQPRLSRLLPCEENPDAPPPPPRRPKSPGSASVGRLLSVWGAFVSGASCLGLASAAQTGGCPQEGGETYGGVRFYTNPRHVSGAERKPVTRPGAGCGAEGWRRPASCGRACCTAPPAPSDSRCRSGRAARDSDINNVISYKLVMKALIR